MSTIYNDKNYDEITHRGLILVLYGLHYIRHGFVRKQTDLSFDCPKTRTIVRCSKRQITALPFFANN